MSEIEKMYMRCKIKKQQTCRSSDTCYNGSLNRCEGCNSYQYPPFTPEKQLELFKLLIKHPKTEVYCRYANSKYKLIMYTEDCCAHDMDSFESALASVVCDVWGLLSEEERKQIAEILRG